MYTKEQIELARLTGTIEDIYGDGVNELLRKRYSLSQELAILRKRDLNPDEFEEYNKYAEQCKDVMKTIIGGID